MGVVKIIFLREFMQRSALLVPIPEVHNVFQAK
jgi:hypothetical protein